MKKSGDLLEGLKADNAGPARTRVLVSEVLEGKGGGVKWERGERPEAGPRTRGRLVRRPRLARGSSEPVKATTGSEQLGVLIQRRALVNPPRFRKSIIQVLHRRRSTSLREAKKKR